MKLLRSPVFYFGLLLALSVAVALIAPFVVDWGRYRGDLQAWGEKLTGRQVAIRGDISVRLFPFPRLTANDVAIANPDGFKEPVFATIDTVTVQITLGGLINGDLQVEAIDLERPSVTLIRSADKRLNWVFEPSGSVRSSRLLEHVLLDQIKVIEGHLYFIDEVRGIRTDLKNVAATLSAPSLSGPWRSAGSFGYGGSVAEFSVSTVNWEQGKPFSFTVKLSPADNAGYSVLVDTQMETGGGIAGHVHIQPVVDPEGKSNSEGRFRNISFRSEFKGDFQHLELDKIEIRPADANDQGTLITGHASVDVGKVVNAKIDISAPRVDLDVLAGAGSRQLLRDGGGLALLDGLLRSLPAEVELAANVEVLALRAGGENLENAKMQFTANRQEVRVSKLSASLPGRSRMLFDGVFYPGGRAAELAGKLALETFDARALAKWVAPEVSGDIARVWTGSRGHLKFESVVRLTASKLSLAEVAYELNGDAGTGQLSMLVNGDRPILAIELHAKRLSIDDFIEQAASAKREATWTWFLASFAEEQSRRDLDLVVTADELVLNGVTAKALAANIETTVRGFDLKSFEIAEPGGAKIAASGLILKTDAGADGDIRATFNATQPGTLLTMLGVVPRDSRPAWLQSLGKTDLEATLAARAGQQLGSLSLTVRGTSGDFTISGDGVLGVRQLDAIPFNGEFQVSSQHSAALWSLLGSEQAVDDKFPASVRVKLDGKLGAELLTHVELQTYGVSMRFDGTSGPGLGFAKGQFAAESMDVAPFLDALKVPLVQRDVEKALPVSLAGQLQFSDNTLAVPNFSGGAGAATLSGNFQLGSNRKLTGNLNMSQASLIDMMALGFLPWNGPANVEKLFVPVSASGLSGELWFQVEELEFYPGLRVPDTQVAITASAQARQVAAYGKGPGGEKIAVDVTLDASASESRISGSAALPFDLSRVIRTVDDEIPFVGTATIDIKFEAPGLSPAVALSSLTGSGAISLVGVTIKGVSPAKFSERIGGVSDPAGLQQSLQAMRSGDGMTLQPTFGALTIKNGVAKANPFGVRDA